MSFQQKINKISQGYRNTPALAGLNGTSAVNEITVHSLVLSPWEAHELGAFDGAYDIRAAFMDSDIIGAGFEIIEGIVKIHKEHTLPF